MKGRVSPVFSVFSDKEEPNGTLVCFPFAGGKADVFRDWHHFFSGHASVLAVNFRGRRPGGQDDELLNNTEEVATEITQALEARFTEKRNVWFYGHSFGALIAWICAWQLQERKSHITLRHLFVGGEEGPSRPLHKQIYAKMSGKEFAEHLRKRDLISKAIADGLGSSKEGLSFLEPTRVEFVMDQSFEVKNLSRAPPKLNVPITAYYEAEDDSVLTVDEVELWGNHTTANFESVPIYGPHLFLLAEHNETELCDKILDLIKQQ